MINHLTLFTEIFFLQYRNLTKKKSVRGRRSELFNAKAEGTYAVMVLCESPHLLLYKLGKCRIHLSHFELRLNVF